MDTLYLLTFDVTVGFTMAAQVLYPRGSGYTMWARTRTHLPLGAVKVTSDSR
jgi:hypothetical protein